MKNYQKTFKDWNFRHDMSERVFIIHGWSGSPDEPLLKWLREELESKDIDVVALKMPETDEPKVNYWINFLAKEVGGIDEGTYFIGHSMGCQAIMRYLEMVKGNKRAGGAVFIAPWLHLTNLDEDDVSIAKPWLEEINLENVKRKANEYVAIFSDNDPFVPLSDAEIFKDKLEAKIIIEKNKGHFSEDDGVLSSKTVLKEVLGLMK